LLDIIGQHLAVSHRDLFIIYQNYLDGRGVLAEDIPTSPLFQEDRLEKGSERRDLEMSSGVGTGERDGRS